MIEHRFLVQGSKSEPYEVHFILRDEFNISAYCTCAAGENGMYCKHRMNILMGLSTGIVSDNIDKVEIVKSWLPGTDVEKAINLVFDLEKQAESIKKQLSTAKKLLAKSFIN
jgi:hypothetical protein